MSLNREFSVDRQRREILDAVGLYKIKGTPLGFTAAARLITTIRQIELVEYKDFLLCSNNTERLSARTITDYPWLYLDEHGVYDPFKIVNARSWSDIFNPYTFELRLFVSDTDVVTSTVLSKIERVMDSFSPVCTTGFVTVFPTAIEEDIDLIVTDSYTDVITDYGDVEDIEIGFDSSSYYMHFSPFNVFDINSTVSGTKTINVTGDVTGTLTPGMAVTINGAPTSGVDGIYTVVSRVYNGPDSDIVISENIADSTNEGSLAYGPAPVNFTNSYTARSAFSYYLRIIDIGNTIASTKTIEVTGDYGSIVAAGHVIEVRGAPTAGVNGYYTVVSATYVAGPNRTDIVVQENIPDSTSEGDVYYGVFESELWWDVITSVEGEETGMTEVVSVLGVN